MASDAFSVRHSSPFSAPVLRQSSGRERRVTPSIVNSSIFSYGEPLSTTGGCVSTGGLPGVDGLHPASSETITRMLRNVATIE